MKWYFQIDKTEGGTTTMGPFNTQQDAADCKALAEASDDFANGQEPFEEQEGYLRTLPRGQLVTTVDGVETQVMTDGTQVPVT